MILKIVHLVIAFNLGLTGFTESGVTVAQASHIHGKDGSHKERAADGAFSPRDAHHHHVSYNRF